jgi:tryptophan 2,3-dioxygenase
MKYTTIHYHSYLGLDKLLNSQVLRSDELETPAHEEMLFIITHQAYELWFKQIIHELDSVMKMFKSDNVDERSIAVTVRRLARIEEILKLLIQQIGIMETMTPLDFLDFRAYLFPASGFQSFQFRMIEAMLGLPEQNRLTYNNYHYSSVFQEEQQKELDDIYANGTLFQAVESWLERIPFIKFGDFDFLKHYEVAVKKMLAKEEAAIMASDYLSDKNKEMRLKMLGGTDTYFKAVNCVCLIKQLLPLCLSNYIEMNRF